MILGWLVSEVIEDLLARVGCKVVLMDWVLKDPKAVKDLKGIRVCVKLKVLKESWDPRVLQESKVQWESEQMLVM